MTYAELKSRQSKEMNDFPLGAAFSLQSFEEMMKNGGLQQARKIVERYYRWA